MLREDTLLLYPLPPLFHRGGGCIDWNAVEKRCYPEVMTIPIFGNQGLMQFVISCAIQVGLVAAPSFTCTYAPALQLLLHYYTPASPVGKTQLFHLLLLNTS